MKQMPFGVLSVQCGDWYAIYNNVITAVIVLVAMMPLALLYCFPIEFAGGGW